MTTVTVQVLSLAARLILAPNVMVQVKYVLPKTVCLAKWLTFVLAPDVMAQVKSLTNPAKIAKVQDARRINTSLP